MKKKRAAKSHRVHKVRSVKSYALGGSNKQLYGIDYDFILIVGGAFVLVILGIMFLYY